MAALHQISHIRNILVDFHKNPDMLSKQEVRISNMKLVGQILFYFSILVAAAFAVPVHAQTPDIRLVPQPEAAIWSTITVTEAGFIKFYNAGSADAACRIQHQITNPLATYVGIEHGSDSDRSRGCRWIRYLDGGPVGSNTALGVSVQSICPENYTLKGDLCYPNIVQRLPICNGDCGSSPVSGTPQPNVGNPININSGLKVLSETDYSTADGLFSVERKYVSRSGQGWQSLLPGYLEMGGQFNASVKYFALSGGQDEFVAANLVDQNDWTFRVPTFQGSSQSVSRRRLSMVTPPSATRSDFQTNPNVLPTAPAEMRLEMANGDYILFRRANGPPLPSGGRRLVPVEHSKPGGYKTWYDYNNDGFYPYRIRDSLNRQFTITWMDVISPPGFSASKVISRIDLPDTTRLDYEYDDNSSSFNVPIPQWALQLGYEVQTSTPGSITVKIDGRRDRMRSVSRRAVDGSLLWARQYDYNYNYNPGAMTRIRDQNGMTLASYTYKLHLHEC